MIEEDVSWV